MHGVQNSQDDAWSASAYRPLPSDVSSSQRSLGAATLGSTSQQWHSPSFQSQQWVVVDTVGRVSVVRADRQRIVAQFNVPYRDLRMLDPTLRVPYPLSLFVRSKAIIVNFESIRMIITKDEAYVLSVPATEDSLLVGAPATPEAPFVKHLLRRVRMADANPEFDSMMRHAPFDASLPFELRCLEAALDGATHLMDRQTSALEQSALPVLHGIAQKVTRPELEGLRDLRSHLSKLTNRVTKLKQELETVLGNEGEMKMMYLSRIHEEEQLEASAPEAAPSLEQSQSGNPFEPAAAAQDDASTAGDAPADGADQSPKRVQMVAISAGTVRRGSSARDAWRHSVKLTTQMLNTINSLKEATFKKQTSWDCAQLLDSNLMEVDGLVQRLSVLRERIISTEKFVDAILDQRRNELVSLDIFITAVMTVFGFVSMIGGIFGMNLPNGWEASHAAFQFASLGSVVAGVLMFCLIIGFAWRKQLLLIPQGDSSRDKQEEY